MGTPAHDDAALDQALIAAIQAERAAQDKTLQQLADAAGMTYQTVQRYLDGKRPIRIAALRQMAVALGVKVSDLYLDAERRLTRQGAGRPDIGYPESLRDAHSGADANPAAEYSAELEQLVTDAHMPNDEQTATGTGAAEHP